MRLAYHITSKIAMCAFAWKDFREKIATQVHDCIRKDFFVDDVYQLYFFQFWKLRYFNAKPLL